MKEHTTHFDDCGCKSGKMQKEIEALRYVLMDMVNQHTAIYEGLELKGYDSGYLSTNENTLDFCVEIGLIRKEQVIR